MTGRLSLDDLGRRIMALESKVRDLERKRPKSLEHERARGLTPSEDSVIFSRHGTTPGAKRWRHDVTVTLVTVDLADDQPDDVEIEVLKNGTPFLTMTVPSGDLSAEEPTITGFSARTDTLQVRGAEDIEGVSVEVFATVHGAAHR